MIRRKYINIVCVLGVLFSINNSEARTLNEHVKDAVRRYGHESTSIDCSSSSYFTIECKVQTSAGLVFVLCQKVESATEEYSCMVVTF